MKIVDLSHKIEEDMSLYFGTEKPNLKEMASIDKYGYRESKISFFSHIGTHIDFPSHIIEDGKSLENFEIESFYGNGVVIDCRNSSKTLRIGMEYVSKIKLFIEKVDFIIFYTGWDKKWKTEEYQIYPEIEEELAIWLSELNLKGIGIDTLSIESGENKKFPIHRKLLEKDVIIIENLNNLEDLVNKIFELTIFPVYLPKAEGIPIRATGIIR